jgi:hypothetical protein
MLTVEQIMDSLRQAIADQRQAGDINALRETQLAAGVLMNAAKWAGDKETARTFQVLAAQAANAQEELSGE